MGLIAPKVHCCIAEGVSGLFCEGAALYEHSSAMAANEVTLSRFWWRLIVIRIVGSALVANSVYSTAAEFRKCSS